MTLRPDDVPHGPVLVGITGLYTISTMLAFALAGLVTWIVGEKIDFPLEFFDVWKIPANVAGGLGTVWFIFVWGFALTAFIGFILVSRRIPREAEPSTLFVRGTWLSINAGLFEELIFRWLLLLVAPVVLVVLNFITFGFIKWFYGELLIPVANWVTFGALEPQLLHANWLLGAAIVSVNGRFRQGHAQQGLLAAVNAWLIGMVMFYLVFNFGMIAAIVAHIAYDLVVFWTVAVTAAFQPWQRQWYW